MHKHSVSVFFSHKNYQHQKCVTEFTEGLYSNNKIASPLLLPYANYAGEGKKGQK